MKIKRILAPFIFAPIFAASIFISSANAKNTCSSEINDILETIPLAGKTVKNLSIISLFDNMRGGSRISGFEGWFSFDQCKGNLIIVVDRACGEQTVYTSGNCEIKGLKNY